MCIRDSNGGDTQQTVNITLLQDSTPEPDETIVVRVTSVVGASVGAVNAITIIDDD